MEPRYDFETGDRQLAISNYLNSELRLGEPECVYV